MTMTPEMLIIGLIAFTAGMLIGALSALAACRAKRIKNVGTFNINHSDPTKDFVNLHLDCDLPAIEDSKVIAFKVIVE